MILKPILPHVLVASLLLAAVPELAFPQLVSTNWVASTSANIAGYNVYRGTATGGPYTKLNSTLISGTTYSDASVQAGQKYYYVATAVDAASNESVHSNEAQAAVPSRYLAASPGSLDFGPVAAGGSRALSVTLRNTGSATVKISRVDVTGVGFSTSGLSLPKSLQAGRSISFKVNFTPVAGGAVTGIVSLSTDAANSPATIAVAGVGISLTLAASPASINFGNVAVSANRTEVVSLVNTGTGSVTISKATVSGTGFSISGLSLPMTLAAGQSTTVQARFAPKVAGTATGSISVRSNAANSPITIPLSGTGASLLLSAAPSSVSFGDVTVGGSGTRAVTLSNTGTGSVTISRLNVGGTGFSAGGLTLPATLAAGQSTTFHAKFTPGAAGAATGSISVISDAKNSPATISLSGRGVSLLLSAAPGSVSFGNVRVGGSGTQAVTLSNTGTGSVTVSQLNASGTGFSASGLTLPVTLAAGQSTTVHAKFTPTTAGAATGSLSVISDATNSPGMIALSGTGVSLLLSAAPGSVSFGNVTVGGSGTQAVTLSNTGTGSATVSQLNVSGPGFSASGLTLPVTLAAGQSTTVHAKFTPAAAGSATGSISVVSDASNSPGTIALSGTGVSLLLSAAPGSVSFGNVTVGGSGTQAVTLSNAGTGSVTVSQVNVSGPGFSASGSTLPVTLAAGQSTTVHAKFAPTAAGTVTGSISVISDATNSPGTIALSGTGVSLLLSAAPATVNFGNVTVGGSGTQAVTLSNTGTGSVTVSQVSVTGAGFSLNGLSLPLTLAAGQSATFEAKFTPTAAGAVTGSISVVSDAANSPATISVAGTGVSLVLSTAPSSVAFGSVSVGSSVTQAVTLSNTGTESITISQVTVSGSGFSIGGLSFPATLAAGQSATLQVVFAPASAGAVSGSVSVLSNATNSPAAVGVSGTGVSLYLTPAPSSVDFGSLQVGSSSQQSIILNNTGTGRVTVSQANVTGSEFSLSGLALPLNLEPGESASLNVVFAPRSAGTFAGNVQVVSTAANSPANTALSGVGVLVRTVALTWTASTSANVIGYNVFRATSAGGPYVNLNMSPVSATSYTDTGIQAGQTYYYVTTAVDTDYNESVYSNEAQAVVPGP